VANAIDEIKSAMVAAIRLFRRNIKNLLLKRVKKLKEPEGLFFDHLSSFG
jgi:hypothetical protein